MNHAKFFWKATNSHFVGFYGRSLNFAKCLVVFLPSFETGGPLVVMLAGFGQNGLTESFRGSCDADVSGHWEIGSFLYFSKGVQYVS